MFDLKGIVPPLVTPFDESGAVQYSSFERNFDRYIQAGIEGFLVLGSNGESVYLEHDEKLKLIESARKRVPSSMMLLAGTGVETTAGTIRLCKEAAERGVDAVLVKTPFFYKAMMTHDVLVQHYTSVADASPVPVVIYSVPVFTGISIEARTAIALSRHPNIAGIKESSGNVTLVQDILWNTDPARFSLVVGAAATLFPNLVSGARGGIIAIACAAPRVGLELYEAHRRGNLARARSIQRIMSTAAYAVTGKYGIAGLKAAMVLEGFEAGVPRRPLLPLGLEGKRDLEQIFRRMKNELAELPSGE
jgi:dihydrodipicolinate synthase/N-acetylneuraminate lyase